MKIVSGVSVASVLLLTGCMPFSKVLPVQSEISVPGAAKPDTAGMMQLYIYKGGVANNQSIRDGYFVMFSPVEKLTKDTAENNKPVIIYRD